jgi:hypothetical protein
MPIHVVVGVWGSSWLLRDARKGQHILADRHLLSRVPFFEDLLLITPE